MSLEKAIKVAEEGLIIDDLRSALANTQKQLAKVKKNRDDFTQAVVQSAHDAMLSLGPIPPVPTPPKDSRTKRGEVALLHSTDWQLGKKTLTYNTKECERLVKQSIDKTIKITEIQRTHHPVKECVLMLGGDIVENTTIFPSQPYEVDSDIMEQFIDCFLRAQNSSIIRKKFEDNINLDVLIVCHRSLLTQKTQPRYFYRRNGPAVQH